MRSSLLRLIDRLRSSYWFLPGLMSLAAILLGIGVVWLDAGPAAGILDGLGWYQSAKPDGAQQVLATIAGSMITIAGVVFSITIVAIAFAANQYGPRILTNFTSDRGNQVTLGTFVATFVYCLVVLRTIRGAETEFVPQLAVMVALLLALASIAVLIYFIHHVTQSIHINTVVARIGRHLLKDVAGAFPADRCGEADPPVPLPPPEECVELRARSAGYVQSIDLTMLARLAEAKGLCLRIECGVGSFAWPGLLLVTAWPRPATRDEARDLADAVLGAFGIGSRRTPLHDLLFLVDELVEIAALALSPGVNDPYTAITCLDWLGAATARAGAGEPQSAIVTDSAGRVRLIVPRHDFEAFVRRGFGRMRPYLARDPNARQHAVRTLEAVRSQCGSSLAAALVAAEVRRLTDEPAPEHSAG